MNVAQIMTHDVIAVTPGTKVTEIAALLLAKGISAALVIDAKGGLLGIVSEGDLLRRAELGTERRPSGWWGRLASADASARDYLKSHANTVGDVMTRAVITIAEMAFLDEIADLLEAKGVRRLPVTRDGKLVGIVSRANLVRALARVDAARAAGTADDHAIRAVLIAELRGKPWASAWAADIMVRDGVVHLWFADDQPADERRALRVAAENTPGVARVEEHLMHVAPPQPM